MFDEIIYALDQQRIVDFNVKQWAESYVIVWAALYEDHMGEEMKTTSTALHQVKYSIIVPTGLELTRLPLPEIIEWLLTSAGLKYTISHTQDDQIRSQYVTGETLSDLARAFNISPHRVHQIVNFKRT